MRPRTADDLKVARIAALTLVNAMIVHQVLAQRDARVRPLSRCVEAGHVAEELARAWTFVPEEIDCLPIFALAREIISELSGTAGLDDTLRDLARAATRLTSRRAALRHDLMGRIYHRLLADARYFGAFYTTVPAAALLLTLTLDPSVFGVDWSDVDQVRNVRIGDLACGTGTLLKAALQTVVDNHVRARADRQDAPDLPGLHQALVADALWGFDVVAFAIHLAASALAVHDPDVPFGEMRLYTLELSGRRPIELGSLEFLREGRHAAVQADLFGGVRGPRRMTGKGQVSRELVAPRLDLCVMNPPFTRSVGGNLLFGNAPAQERRRMQAALGTLVRDLGVKASITAGLGSVFVALGHRLLKATGHLSLVLPRALLSGVAWQVTRALIGSSYQVRYIVVSHEPGGWNFSENTRLSECLIVASRLKADEARAPTKVVNLWARPSSSIEALTVAGLIRRATGVHLERDTGTEELRTRSKKFGEILLAPAERIRAGTWRAEAAFAQTDLSRAAHYLSLGTLFLPARGIVGPIRLAPLRRFGALGPDVRDIHDGFERAANRTAYAALWGHETSAVRRMAQAPNAHLQPLPRARPGRPLRDPHLLWSRAGRLLLAERLRLTTARVTSVRLEEAVLSNTWWPVAVGGVEGCPAEDAERILALWFNSSLGILSLVAARVETEGSWIKFKKPLLKALDVLDLRSLSAFRRDALVASYDQLAGEELAPLPAMAEDPARARIDSAVMGALGTGGDLAALRRLIAGEPLVRGDRA